MLLIERQANVVDAPDALLVRRAGMSAVISRLRAAKSQDGKMTVVF